MKRKFSVIGFSFMLALLLANNVFGEYSWILPPVLLIVLFLLRKLKKHELKRRLRLVISAVLAATVIYTVYDSVYVIPAKKYIGEKSQIEGTLISECTPLKSGNHSSLIRATSINGEKCNFKIILYTPEDIAALPGYTVNFSSYPFSPGNDSKRSQNYYLSKKIVLGAYTKYGVTVRKNDKNSLYSKAIIERRDSVKILRSFLPQDCAEFSNSILFGDKSSLPEDIYSSLKQAGITHITAVSGLHISVWVFGLYALLRKLKIRKNTSSAVCIGFAIVVMVFSSFSASVVRAFIMTAVYFGGVFFKRKSDALNSLGFAAALILTVNPFATGDPSFLLSFFATLGIIAYSENKPRIFFQGYTRRFVTGSILGVADFILFTISAGIFSYPVSVNFFGHIPVYSWLANLLCSPVVTPCLILSGLLTLFPTLDTVYFGVSKLLTVIERYIFYISKAIGRLPFAYPEANGILFMKIIPVAAVLIILFLRFRKTKHIELIPLLSGACITAAAILV